VKRVIDERVLTTVRDTWLAHGLATAQRTALRPGAAWPMPPTAPR
jgi:hypothetical protein